MATLTAISHNGPVIVRELGKGHDGVVWTVRPDQFGNVIAMINSYGGPACWSITAA